MFGSFQYKKNCPKQQRLADISDSQHNVTSLQEILKKKRISKLFLAVAPPSHELSSLTWRVFGMGQQPLVHR
jgi:hypothetical protein